MSEQSANTPAVETAEKKEFDAIVAGVAKNLGDGVATTLNDALKGFKEDLQLDQKKKELEEKEAAVKAKEEAVKKEREELENEKVAKATLETKGAGVSIANGVESAEINPILAEVANSYYQKIDSLIPSVDFANILNEEVTPSQITRTNGIKFNRNNITADGEIIDVNAISELSKLYDVQLDDSMPKNLSIETKGADGKATGQVILTEKQTGLQKYKLVPKNTLETKGADGVVNNMITSTNSFSARYRTRTEFVLSPRTSLKYRNISPWMQKLPKVSIPAITNEEILRENEIDLFELMRKADPVLNPLTGAKVEQGGYDFTELAALASKNVNRYKLVSASKLVSMSREAYLHTRSGGTVERQFITDMLNQAHLAAQMYVGNAISPVGAPSKDLQNPNFQSQAIIPGLNTVLGDIPNAIPLDQVKYEYQKADHFRILDLGDLFVNTNNTTNKDKINLPISNFSELALRIRSNYGEAAGTELNGNVPLITNTTIFNQLIKMDNKNVSIKGNDGQRTDFIGGDYMAGSYTVSIGSNVVFTIEAMDDRFFPDPFNRDNNGNISVVNNSVFKPNALLMSYGKWEDYGVIAESSILEVNNLNSVAGQLNSQTFITQNNGISSLKNIMWYLTTWTGQFIPNNRQKILQIKAPSTFL